MNTPLRRLGQSNIYLSALGIGTWQYSNKTEKNTAMWQAVASETIYDIVAYSLQHGMNWLDTAEIYGNGTSEAFVGETLTRLAQEKKLDYQPLVATKWFPLARSYKSILNTIEKRLNFLQTKTIDLYQIHQPTSRSSLKNQINAMAELVEAGKIKQVGVSNFSVKQMIKADELLKEHGLSLASNQIKYNLLHRKPEKSGMIDAARERGISIIAYSPLQQGVLTGRFHENPESIKNINKLRRVQSSIHLRTIKETKPLFDALKRLSLEYEQEISQISLNWLIHSQGDTVFAIPGASKLQQAQQNIATLAFKLTNKEIQLLNDLSKPFS